MWPHTSFYLFLQTTKLINFSDWVRNSIFIHQIKQVMLLFQINFKDMEMEDDKNNESRVCVCLKKSIDKNISGPIPSLESRSRVKPEPRPFTYVQSRALMGLYSLLHKSRNFLGPSQKLILSLGRAWALLKNLSPIPKKMDGPRPILSRAWAQTHH